MAKSANSTKAKTKVKQKYPKISTTMRFHVVALPHTQTTLEYEVCAYTAKVRKFCNMMKSLGHTVFLYASEENDAQCDELITVASREDQRRWFGDHDYKIDFFNISSDVNDPYWSETNKRTIEEISKRQQPKDFICVVGGHPQKPIADALPHLMTVEFGIGYSGVFAPYKVFESYAWMHYMYGTTHDDNGRFFDAVIPNYFEPENFELKTKKDDYYLFIGRFINRKGPEIAAEVTKRIGAKLVMAGQGVKQIVGNTIIGQDVSVSGDHILHVGHANVEQRKKLMAGAKAVFVPTTYLEPFGGVSIEALMSGTPVIATDFGVFPENIQHGVHGYRFRTIGEAVYAAQNVDKFDSKELRRYAIDNFSVDRVKYQYQAYFEQLLSLWEDGFYASGSAGISEFHRYNKY